GLISGIAGRVLGAEFRYFTIGAAFAGEQIAPIWKWQKILRTAFDDAQSMLAQFQIVDDLGLQQADGVRGDRVTKSGMEFFRHAGAPDDTTPLEDADAQSGHPQIGRAGEAIVAAANDDRIEIGHCLLKARRAGLTHHFKRSLWDRIFMAFRIRSATLRAPIRSITQARWFSTVFGLMLSLIPISLLERPATASSMTSRCRAERLSKRACSSSISAASLLVCRVLSAPWRMEASRRASSKGFSMKSKAPFCQR